MDTLKYIWNLVILLSSFLSNKFYYKTKIVKLYYVISMNFHTPLAFREKYITAYFVLLGEIHFEVRPYASRANPIDRINKILAKC